MFFQGMFKWNNLFFLFINLDHNPLIAENGLNIPILKNNLIVVLD